jgi:hypothetical protein
VPEASPGRSSPFPHVRFRRKKPVLRNYAITRAPADVRDASHPAPIRRAPRGFRRFDGGSVASRRAHRGRPGRRVTEGRSEPARSRHGHAAVRRRSRDGVSSSRIEYLRSTTIKPMAQRRRFSTSALANVAESSPHVPGLRWALVPISTPPSSSPWSAIACSMSRLGAESAQARSNVVALGE